MFAVPLKGLGILFVYDKKNMAQTENQRSSLEKRIEIIAWTSCLTAEKLSKYPESHLSRGERVFRASDRLGVNDESLANWYKGPLTTPGNSG